MGCRASLDVHIVQWPNATCDCGTLDATLRRGVPPNIPNQAGTQPVRQVAGAVLNTPTALRGDEQCSPVAATTGAPAPLESRLVVTGRTRRLELGANFTIIGRECDDTPIGYIADSLEAVDICDAMNQHHALVAALKAVADENTCTLRVMELVEDALWQCERRGPP